MESIYYKIEASFKIHLAIFWANLARLNNLLIILNVTFFFLTGLVAQGYYYTFCSIACFVGIYYQVVNVVYWIRTEA
jgi:hypothetical protein